MSPAATLARFAYSLLRGWRFLAGPFASKVGRVVLTTDGTTHERDPPYSSDLFDKLGELSCRRDISVLVRVIRALPPAVAAPV